jgi:Glycosyl hydrolase family 59
MRRRICAVLFLAAATKCQAAEKTIVLDAHASGRIFDGIGVVSAGASSRLLVDYPEPYRSQVLDYLFKPNYGASLQHLKVEVGGDVNSTDGSEPSHMRSRDDHDFSRGYEWWLMEEAHRRNPEIILDILPWGAPGWIGNGTYYSPDMAKYMADFIEGAKKHHGLDIQYAGIWNEKAYDALYGKELRREFQKRGLKTKIVCCDEYPGEHQWRIAEAMESDSALADAVDVLSVHYPQTEDGALTTTHQAKAIGKPLWSSEDQPNSGGGPIVPRDWAIGGRILANVYNRNYLEGTLTKTEIWSPVTSYYDNLAAPNSGLMYANTPWSGYYNVQSTIWVTAHTTQFAKPGWQYLDPACGYLPEKGTFVSFKSPKNHDWSIVAETISAKAPQTVTFEIRGGLSTATVHVWETNASKTFEHVADFPPANGAVKVTLDPDSIYSLTTTTGQAKGTAQPPANAPFPMPYRDDFEAVAVNRAPKYLADQDGAFEVHPCRQREGKCLEQVITQKPIPWGPIPNPFTMAGDADWTDYSVQADVLLDRANEATVIGRIDSADVFQDGNMLWPSGYVLRLQKSGEWALLSAKYKSNPRTLASGSVSLNSGEWHAVGLRFKGEQITASLDHRQLAAVEDKSHRRGMVAIGTDWGRAQFDNLSVRP